MTEDKLKKGSAYKISYTRPRYDRQTHRFAPDSYRFVNPIIETVFYGGRCPEPRRCSVCGRKSADCRVFVRERDMLELFFSDHCFRHESTRMWNEDDPDGIIRDWYAVEDLERAHEAGDAAASLVKAFEDLE